MPFVVITGASSGIGKQFAYLLARDDWNFILVARRQQLLEELAQELRAVHNAQCHVLALDLADTASVDAIEQFIDENELDVKGLINNAGIGERGIYIEQQSTRITDVVRVNDLVPSLLIRRLVPKMADNKGGWVINVSSLVALMPNPNLAVYAASKAYLLHLSQALAYELKSRGVHVMALCPGPVGTEFIKKARLDKTWLLNGPLQPQAPRKTAYLGYRDMRRGKTICYPGLRTKVMAFLLRWLPKAVNMRIMALLMRRK